MPASIFYRLGGLLAILLGAGLFWFFLWAPLQQAMAGAPEVRFELRAFAGVPLCLVFGFAFLLLGENLQYRNAEHTNLTPVGWTLFVLVAVLTIAGYLWFNQQFAGLGYY